MLKSNIISFVFIYALLFLFGCTNDEFINPADNPDFLCEIDAVILNQVLISTGNGGSEVVRDTLEYHYNEDDELIIRPIYSDLFADQYDSLTYKNGMIDKVYNIIRGEIYSKSSFNYLDGSLISCVNHNERNNLTEIDSFFYDSQDVLNRITTYKDFPSWCGGYYKTEELKFVYESDGQNLLRDTLFIYERCGSELESYMLTEYSDHSTIKNPLFRSPFKEHYQESRNRNLIFTISSKTFTAFYNDYTYESYSSFSVAPSEINEYGYPSFGYLYKCF